MCEKYVKEMAYYIANLKINKQRWKGEEGGKTYSERQKALGGELEKSRKVQYCI